MDKLKFVQVKQFKKKIYVDLRNYYEKEKGEEKEVLPTQKGISLSLEQWRLLTGNLA